MSVLIIIVVIIAVLWGVIAGINRLRPTYGMSVASAHLYKQYKSLPQDSRPFPDIKSILHALDHKYALDRSAMRLHFNVHENRVLNGQYDYGVTQFIQFGWNSGCRHTDCEFKEYGLLHNAMKDVQESLNERQRTILALQTNGATDMAKELTDALRREANLQRDVTRELH